MPFATLNGATLHYAARPAAEGAPTLLFSNSLGTDLRVWDALVPLLPAALGVVRYDTRGHGLSDAAPGEELATHVADVAALVAHLELRRVVMVGLSVGGVIAQGVAQTRPDLLCGLVLCCTAARIGTREDWQARIATVEADGLSALAAPTMERWFSPGFHQREPAILAGMVNMLTRQTPAGYVALCAMLGEADLTAEAGRIDIPTLAIAGSLDVSTPPALMQDTAARIRGARLEVIEGVAHIPCVEVPHEVASRIGAFLVQSELWRG